MEVNPLYQSEKKHHYSKLFIVFVLCLYFPSSPLYAGGFRLSVARVDGFDSSATVKPNQETTICYRLQGYLYSGHGNEYAHILFAAMPTLKIRGSVGKGGINHQEDVKKIINALTDARLLDQDISAKDINAVSQAIETFQRKIGSSRPDSRIDPGGRTIRTLLFETNGMLFAKLYKSRKYGDTSSADDYSLKNCVIFKAPAQPGTYTIRYQQFPLITQYPLIRDEHNELSDKQNESIRKTLRSESYRQWKQLASIIVTSKPQMIKRNLATYMRINDKFPGVVENIKPGDSPKPITFSWHTKPGFDDIEFSYRLYPDQPKFSKWSKRKAIPYFFIGSGAHTFEVATRYPDDRGQHVILPIADYNFFLERPFISKPVMYKAAGGQIDTMDEMPDLNNLYAKSKALLIGITGFEKMSLLPLPYVKQDILRMENALQKHGFQITKVLGEKTKNDIITAIENFLLSLQANDRVIIYFSTHGFQDKEVKSTAYLAAYNCDPDIPGIHCIELSDLERRMKKALAKPVKHLLIVLDACAAGLGVIAKSPEYQELTIATEPGAHMITAGMVNQKAEMDNVEQISTFTRFLTDGLEGAADYTNDQVVSLTELLLFVRYQVAHKTKGAQTPMIGRFDGSGEMIFQMQ